MDKDTTKLIRLCGACSCGYQHQADTRVRNGAGNLLFDRRCFACGNITATMVYVRQQPHPWLLFWTCFLLAFIVLWALYAAGRGVQEIRSRPSPATKIDTWFKPRPKEIQ